VFCPGYQSGCRLGMWYARRLSTTGSWAYGSSGYYDWSDDVGAVVVSADAERGYLVDAVGGQGIAFNTNIVLQRHAFGYPAADDRWPEYSYDGESLIYCPDTDTYDGAGHVSIACTMTGGSSGGPWLINPSADWLGYVNSVNSHKAWGGPYMGGPYFGRAEADLYDHAATL
jgi:hypothetical protein